MTAEFDPPNPGLHFPYLDDITADADGARYEQDYLALERFADRLCKGLHIPYKQWLRLTPNDPQGPQWEEANLLAIERWAAGIGRCCAEAGCCWDPVDMSSSVPPSTNPSFAHRFMEGFGCDQSGNNLYLNYLGDIVDRITLDGTGAITSYDIEWRSSAMSTFGNKGFITGVYDDFIYIVEEGSFGGNMYAIDTSDPTSMALVTNLADKFFPGLAWSDRGFDGVMYGAGTTIDLVGPDAPFGANTIFSLTPAGVYTVLHANPYGTSPAPGQRVASKPRQLTTGEVVFVEGYYINASTNAAYFLSKVNPDGTGYTTVDLPSTPESITNAFDQSPIPRPNGEFWLNKFRFNRNLELVCTCDHDLDINLQRLNLVSLSDDRSVIYGAVRSKMYALVPLLINNLYRATGTE